MLVDSSLVARRLCPVVPLIVAAPSYLARYGSPQHPRGLATHHCLGYAYSLAPAARRRSWHPPVRFASPTADALIPTVVDGLSIAELPDFIASVYLAGGRLAAGNLYFVTPTRCHRPAKIEVFAEFLAAHLSRPGWAAP